MSLLNQLTKIKTKSAKRVGRGYGSGVGGHTIGRGTKGQISKLKMPLWFEGGQLPMIKRYPMLRGKSRLKPLKQSYELTLDRLARFADQTIDLKFLKDKKLVSSKAQSVKIILGRKKLETKIHLENLSISKQAKDQIVSLGGSVK